MSRPADVAAEAPRPARIAERYTVLDTLGRGGMACVYRVVDTTTGGQLALKQLHFAEDDAARAGVTALFEREFHTLSQLSHPRVIAVYDFGVDPVSGPYYTMELLDGGDLRARAPLPWREASTLLFDVCSSLALLHSRRLLHRDISPRNIRCTHDGKAKLIDFGAMAPIGPSGGAIVGTPAFTPPESLHHSALDARTDLFALGASLYYALTGEVAYPARTFAEVLVAWNSPVAPPSARVPGIPAALDDLVMSLLSLEPALRPPSAFEVMQRLAAIAGLECVEPAGVARAYLTTPVLVGRDAPLASVRERLTRSLAGRGGGVIIAGVAGVGRSRMLDACALEAKTLGATVLRATASGAQEPYAVALALTRHVTEAVPNAELAARFFELFDQAELLAGRAKLKSATVLRADPERLQRAICGFILALAKTHPLVVAVDDAHRIDEPSAAVLAELVEKARRARILVALTAETQAAGPTPALHVLAGRCVELSLSALDRAQTQALLGSLFGDVANLELVAHEVYKIARGNPRQCMDVAQHLVDRGSIEYRAGRWTLPSAVSSADLPASAEDAIHARLLSLSPLARWLGEAHALAFLAVWSHDDYRNLRAELDPRAIDAAIAELLSQQALTLDGAAYTLANRVWADAFKAGLPPLDLAQRHRALAQLYRRQPNLKLALIHHLFAAGLDEQGLDAVLVLQEEFAENFDLRAVLEMNAANFGPSFVRALETAERLKRPARQLHEVRRWLLAQSVTADAAYYYRTAPAWLAQLKLDSGLSFWLEDAQNTDAGARITNALTRANECYLAAPESERVYGVEEAIRFLAQFVAFSIAIGARTIDTALLATLPGLLEPFAILSPVIEAIRQNAMATCDSNRDARTESARTRWMAVHAKLSEITGTELQHVETIRNAVAYAVGMAEAALGLPSAAEWAARIDHDPMQKLSALYLRKIVRLQQGDWSGADRLRRQAEILSLQARAPQMFTTLLVVELAVQVQARDLVGVKEVMARIALLAAQHAGWRPHLLIAEASFELIRGDLIAAKRGFEACVEMTEQSGDQSSRAPWIAAHAGLCEVLLGLGQVEQARECARAALATCDALQIRGQAHELRRMLALADAKLGNFAAASERLDSMIEEQVALGVSGLKLGLSYEARAQVAIWSGDVAGFERVAQLTAREYRHGAKCPLSARYERLVHEARRCGLPTPLPASSELASTIVDSGRTALHDVRGTVRRALAGVEGTEERARRALALVCDTCAARGGHFYLTSRDRLVLAASQGLPPPLDLERRVREYLTRELASSEVLTMVASSSTSSSSATSHSSASTHAEAPDYVLLLVAGVHNQVSHVAGVMALAFGKGHAREAQQAQLLAAIATELHVNASDDRASGDPG